MRPMGRARSALPFFHARRLALSALLAIALGAAFRAAGLSYSRAALLAFDVAALVFLLATARRHAGHAAIHARTRAAGRRGPQRGAVEQRGDLLPDRHGAVDGAALIPGASGALDMVAAAVSIVLSWLYMNMIFALHYAHGYYSRRSPTHKGLEFPARRSRTTGTSPTSPWCWA